MGCIFLPACQSLHSGLIYTKNTYLYPTPILPFSSSLYRSTVHRREDVDVQGGGCTTSQVLRDSQLGEASPGQ